MTDNNTEPRNPDFKVIIDEWTNTLLDLNTEATIPEVILITRIGMLGHKLIAQAYATGLDAALQALREKA